MRRSRISDPSATVPGVFQVSSYLRPSQVDAALRELGVDAEAILELGGWKTSSDDVAVARVPFPRGTDLLAEGRPVACRGDRELEVDAWAVQGLGGWRTSSDVGAAFVSALDDE